MHIKNMILIYRTVFKSLKSTETKPWILVVIIRGCQMIIPRITVFINTLHFP